MHDRNLPRLGCKMQCYHMEYISNGSVRCDTWSGEEPFTCADVTDISSPPLPTIKELNSVKVTLIQLSKEFRFADGITAEAFRRQEKTFQEANRHHDLHHDLQAVLTIPGFQGAMIVSAQPAPTKPFIFGKYLYILALCMLLDLPYLCICNLYWSKIVKHTVIKKFGKPLDARGRLTVAGLSPD
ncbi:uncharacterized protein LOC129591478 isoform X2 [Paramacrobiotus metropolitanus]|uniref:uncharacterized protein LOC129591478 isoform X2 n=1 Tax=Paramacrobiotus metropolitanus TaxID=2943436 RepID=UPI002445B933|nr:uncharacterized protein LOC129591478 isoform X2 [Paramacrobiotus metropolitanus]